MVGAQCGARGLAQAGGMAVEREAGRFLCGWLRSCGGCGSDTPAPPSKDDGRFVIKLTVVK